MEKRLSEDDPQHASTEELLEKQLRALAAMYKTMQLQQETLDKIRAQQEAPIKGLTENGGRAIGMQPVKVEDINMPFWALVGFLAKLAFASIPAAIILYVATFVVLMALWIFAMALGFAPSLPF